MQKPEKFHKTLVAAAISLSTLSTSNLVLASDTLEEVLVTAARRSQSVEDIPYNISALSGEALKDSGAGNMQDLTRMIPGLTSADFGPRSSSVSSALIIRGLSSGGGAQGASVPNVSVPLVSTYVDETPLFVNLKLTDMARVEVLRGPQGTLYGSGSMGGTLRMIHNQPSTDGFMAEVSTKVSSTEEADDLSYSVEGIINLPQQYVYALADIGAQGNANMCCIRLINIIFLGKNETAVQRVSWIG